MAGIEPTIFTFWNFGKFQEFSMTRWQDYFSNFWPFTTMKVCHWRNVCKSRRTIMPNTKPSKDCQRVLKYWQSGEILANLVTLSKMKIRVLKFSCRSFKISSGHTHTRLYTTDRQTASSVWPDWAIYWTLSNFGNN